MGLKAKLNNWVESDMISQDQSNSILQYERSNLQNRLACGLKYSALFAIILGIALVIASNWNLFGMHAKLIGHVGINGILAYLIWRWKDDTGKKLWHDVCVYGLFGLTLTLLALIGQSFQLQGSIGGLLALWMILVTGFVIMQGRNSKISNLWCFGFIVTVGYNLELIGDIEPSYFVFVAILSLITFIPLLFSAVGNEKWLIDRNEPFANMLLRYSAFFTILCAFASSFIFYDGVDEIVRDTQLNNVNFNLIIGLFVAALSLASLAIIQFSPSKDTFFRTITITAIAFILVPFILPIESEIMAALHFIGFSSALAWIAVRNGHNTFLTLCLFAISARVFVIFIELFGSMFATGFGLIIGGLLLLSILKATQMIRKNIVGGMHEK